MNESEAPPLLKRNLSLHDHRASIAAENGTTRPAQQGHRPTRATRNNCGTSAVFCPLNHRLSLNIKGMSTTLSRLQLWELDCLPQLCTYNTTTTLSMYCREKHRNGPWESASAPRRKWRRHHHKDCAHGDAQSRGMSTGSKNCKQPRPLHEHRDVHSTGTARLSAPTAGATGSDASASCTTTSRAPGP